MGGNILAIDQGTTSSRAILFDGNGRVSRVGQKEFTQYLPRSGWVEHDVEEIWASVLETCSRALEGEEKVAAIGITNQRETVVVWDKETGKPVFNAIVWQDRRTSDFCAALKTQGAEAEITRKTGLLLDPYFSSTKLRWILENVEGVRARAEAGALLFGTIDCFLIWRLTGGKIHATDATNAARTMLYDIHRGCWDKDICELMDIPLGMLPDVRDCSGDFGFTELFGDKIPICGVAGDQQAATVGQACFQPGMLKSTYGTGCFALLNTGSSPITSQNRLLTTIGYQLGGKPTYALEGSIFIAGAVVQWLRDGLKIIEDASQTGDMAAGADETQPLYLVPAFVGLGAPYWDADCRGAIYGLTRGSGPNEFARAALESVGYQTRDLLEAMKADWSNAVQTVLRVDGGMVASDWAMQFLSDILQAPVDRPVVTETTALGAAWLAGSSIGAWPDQEEFANGWALDHRFEPTMDIETASLKHAGWKDAVARTLSR